MSDSNAGKTGMTPELSAVDIQERISMRAYAIYLERGGDGGDPLIDWLAAESAVLAELNADASAAEKNPAARRRSTAGASKSKAPLEADAPESGAVKPANPARRSRSAAKPAE